MNLIATFSQRRAASTHGLTGAANYGRRAPSRGGRGLSAVIAATLFIGACGGGGANGFEPRFLAVHTAMAAMGVPQTGPLQQGSLPEGDEVHFPLTVAAGECRTVVALGSEEVDDINLSVLRQDGTLVTNDSTVDRQAAARVCSSENAAYTLVVSMAAGSGGYTVSYWGGAGAPGDAAGSGSGEATCENPGVLTLGVPHRATTIGGQQRLEGSCVRGTAPERVYRVNVSERSQLSVVLQSQFDGALYLMGNCRDSRTEILCNDDQPDTSRSQLDATVEPGTYYIVVDGFGEEAGDYDVLATLSPLRPLTEVCRDATVLPTAGQTLQGTTIGGLNQFQATCAGGAQSPDRVYKLQVDQRSRLRVRQSSEYDGALHLRSRCEEATSEIACNDDAPNSRRSVVTAVTSPGTYYVIVDGYGAVQSGPYTLQAELEAAAGTGIAADRCDNMGSVRPGTLSLDTFRARDDFSGSCGGQGAPDVVYEVLITSRSRLRVRSEAPEYDAILFLQRACGGNAAEIACATAQRSERPAGDMAQTQEMGVQGAVARIQPPPEPPPSEVAEEGLALDAVLEPGRYFLVVDGARPDAFGALELEVEIEDLVALGRSCQRAPLLQVGQQASGDTGGSADRFQASCAGGTRSQDIVYRLRVPRRQRVRVRMESDFDGALHMRRSCTDPDTELACNDDQQDNQHAMVEEVLDAGTYFVIVDGFGTGNAGSYTLSVEMENP